MVRAIACVIDLLKVTKKSNSSAAWVSLGEDFPLTVIPWITFNWFVMFSWTLVRQRLNAAAWLHIYVWARAARSHFLSVSCDTGREAGAEGRERPAILGKLLLRRAGSLVQVYTLEREKSFFSLCIPYHFKVLGDLMN